MSKILIGTSGYTYDDWQGRFYPNDIPKSQWFNYYAQYFPTVEINATYYRFFTKPTYLKWRDAAPRSFQYIVKVPRIITHRKLLLNCTRQIRDFSKLAYLLDKKLGLMLLQLSPRMPYDPDRLYKALQKFDEPKKIAVEFRHPQWLTEEVKEMLTELGCVFVTADSPITQLQDWLTSSTAYIRLHGTTRWYNYNYTAKQLQSVAKLTRELSAQGARKIYIFFNNDHYAYAPHNAIYLQKLLLKKTPQKRGL